MQTDENALLRKAATGDGAAFSSLMEIHERRMYAVALRMCANHEDAQDCLQEAMLRIYRAISSFKGQSSFSTWVYRITMNTCLDELRRRKMRRTTSLDGLLDSGWSPAEELETPENNAIRSEQRRQIDAGKERRARITLLFGVVEISVIAFELRVELALLHLGLLQGDHVGVKRRHALEKALGRAGAQAVDVP